jgi:membrane associated rhomboid family serine protease
MGGYLVLYPRVRVFTWIPLGFFMTSVALPAWVMLFYWFGLQFVGGLGSVADAQKGGTAFWAHVGGFAAGALLVMLFRRADLVRSHRSTTWRPERVGWQ